MSELSLHSLNSAAKDQGANLQNQINNLNSTKLGKDETAANSALLGGLSVDKFVRNDVSTPITGDLVADKIGKENDTCMFFPYVKGGDYKITTYDSTGVIRIKIPRYINDLMIQFRVDILNDKSNCKSTVFISGTLLTSGWNNVSAYTLSGSTDMNLKVRFSNDGNNAAYIFIGESTTKWQRANFVIQDVYVAKNQYVNKFSDWSEGWVIDKVTNASGSNIITCDSTLVKSSYAINSDTVDGLHGTQLLRSDVNTAANGQVTFKGGVIVKPKKLGSSASSTARWIKLAKIVCKNSYSHVNLSVLLNDRYKSGILNLSLATGSTYSSGLTNVANVLDNNSSGFGNNNIFIGRKADTNEQLTYWEVWVNSASNSDTSYNILNEGTYGQNITITYFTETYSNVLPTGYDATLYASKHYYINVDRATNATNADNAAKLGDKVAGNANGNIPINNGTVNTNLNADMVDGKHVDDSSISTNSLWTSGKIYEELKSRENAQTISDFSTSTSGWYRIAKSNSDIQPCNGSFHIKASGTGCHSIMNLEASINYGVNPFILQRSNSDYNTKAITKARIVYNKTYSGNYAYLEVYISASVAIGLNVNLTQNTGWSLMTPIPGSVPSSYTTYEFDTTNGMAVGGNAVFNENIILGNNKKIYTKLANGVSKSVLTTDTSGNTIIGENTGYTKIVSKDHFLMLSNGSQEARVLTSLGGTLDGKLSIQAWGGTSIDGSNINNAALKIGSTLGIDNDELFFNGVNGTIGIIDNTNSKVLNIRVGANTFRFNPDGQFNVPNSVIAGSTVKIADNNTVLSKGSSNALRVGTPNGYIDLGSNTTTSADVSTNKDKFVFNKPLYINGEKVLTGTSSVINAETLGGYKASDFSLATHNHDNAYLKLTGGTVNGNVYFNNNHVFFSTTTDGNSVVRLDKGSNTYHFLSKATNSSDSANARIQALRYNVGNANTYIELGALNTFKFGNASGYVQIGATSSNSVDITTDRGSINFNKEISVGGNKVVCADSSGNVSGTIKVTNVAGYSPGNASGNIPISNGSLSTNLNADMLDGLHATSFTRSEKVNSSYGFVNPNGSNVEAIRTTKNGLLPYDNSLVSNIGSLSSQFNNIYSKNIYRNGTEIGSVFAPKNHSHDIPVVDVVPSTATIGSLWILSK